MRAAQRYIIGALFLAAGALHFVRPRMYEAIVPPFFPAHRTLVLVSGAFEMLGGAGAMVPRVRRPAGWGLIALLIAVFPANLYMALAASSFSRVAPAWLLYARLPLQFVLVWWVYVACIAKPPPRT